MQKISVVAKNIIRTVQKLFNSYSLAMCNGIQVTRDLISSATLFSGEEMLSISNLNSSEGSPLLFPLRTCYSQVNQ